MSSFPKVTLIAVGKIKKGWIATGVQQYHKRVPELNIQEIRDSTPQKEGEQILGLLKPEQELIALTETGKLLSSEQFAEFLRSAASNRYVFVIGSADGLSYQLRQAATTQLSLSPMTFPHEIARLVLLEQLYRAKTILQGGKYHK